MNFHYTDLDDCDGATGVVIVIDVLRAFSTAAYALSRGATQIMLVGTVEEALAIRSQTPNALVMGEVGGMRPDGFDFGNSPTFIHAADLTGRTMIHRTSAGTQGVVRSQGAGVLLAASFVVAGATARFVERLGAPDVTFVITGRSYNGGDEDLACAEYLEALLRGERPQADPFIRRIYEAPDALPHLEQRLEHFPLSDLDYCAALDRFDFAMPVTRENGMLILRPVQPMQR